MRFDTLAEWLHWQERLHLSEIDLGLERPGRVLRAMGLDAPRHRVITVAGTNGKGSSVTMLDAMLRAAGYRTGCYTSPHLLRYNERITIDGEMVTDATLCASFERIDQARGDTSLTYFEFGTLAAFDLFQSTAIDVAILEVGLGGRLDAVNLLDPDLALITAIDIDHSDWLGSERELIAVEKGGIMRCDRPAVCSDPNPPQSLIDLAERQGTSLDLLGHDYGYRDQGNSWEWWYRDGNRLSLPRPALVGSYQLQNAAGVLAALHRLAEPLPVAPQHLRQGLLAAEIAGRFQCLQSPEGVTILLDVAHNPQAATALAANLAAIPCSGNTYGIIAMLADKDMAGVVTRLEEQIDYWYPATLDLPRGASSRDLVALLAQRGIDHASPFDQVAGALAAVRSVASEDDRIVIFGSFHTVAAALELLSAHVTVS